MFRRAVGYLHPHRRSLVIGLIAAVGVSVFYTFSVSSIVPVLKIIFAEHETLVDWMHRAETQRRLGVTIAADLPDDPRGLTVVDIRPSSPSAALVHGGDRIVALGERAGSAYELGERLAGYDGEEIDRSRVVGIDGGERETALRLRPHRWWWPAVVRGAQLLPVGRSPHDRFNALLVVMIAVLVISTLGAVCRFANEGLVAIAVQRAMHDLRTALAHHTLRLPMPWHSTQPPGDTLSRFAQDIGAGCFAHFNFIPVGRGLKMVSGDGATDPPVPAPSQKASLS